MAYAIGTRVKHAGHGEGEVVDHNTRKRHSFRHIVEGASENALMREMCVDAFFDGERYPNVIQFDSGYRDVYADQEVQKICATN